MTRTGRRGRHFVNMVRSLLRRHGVTEAPRRCEDRRAAFEALERRVLLAVDLTAAFNLAPNPQVEPGTAVMVPINLTNGGDTRAAGRLQIDLYASLDDVLDAGDFLLGRSMVQGVRNAGNTANINLHTVVPPSAPAGTYRLIGVLDPDNRIVESSDANNTFVSGEVQVVQPDYDLTAALSGYRGPTAVVAGQPTPASVKVAITNNGTVKTPAGPGKVTVNVVARPTGAADASQDVVLGSSQVAFGNLRAGQARMAMVQLNYAANLPAGDYNLVAVVDTTGQLAETNEANNEATLAATTINVAAPFIDLNAVANGTRVPAAAIAGQGARFVIPVQINNNGNIPTNRGQRIDITVSARPSDAVDDAQDVLIGTYGNLPFSNVQPGKSRTQQLIVPLPDNLPANQYVIVFKVDTANGIAESNENNNEAATAATVNVAPAFTDLTIQSATTNLGNTANGGSAGVANVVLRNLGNVNATGRVDVKVFATTNGVIDQNAIEVGSTTNAAVNMRPNAANKPIRVNLTLPDVANATEYTLVAQVLAGQGITDSSNANNTAVIANTVNVTPVQTFLAPLGDTIVFTRTALNGGPGQGGEAWVETGTWVDSLGNAGTYAYSTFKINLGPANSTVNRVGTILLAESNVPNLVNVNIVATFNNAAIRPQGIGGETIKFSQRGVKDASIVVAFSPGATINGVMNIL